MPVCSFCKKNYKEPRGLTVFTFDGRAVHFCSSKCKRNTDLKRDPKKVNWIKREKKSKPVTEKVEKKE
jgi:large subunit ribosomal protein L24e